MATDVTDPTAERIAEMVAQLTGCGTRGARAAVSQLHDGGAVSADDALTLVARAVHEVGGVVPSATSLRMAGYVRASADRVIDLRDDPVPTLRDELRIAGYVAQGTTRRLVEHGSLRRWERTSVPVG